MTVDGNSSLTKSSSLLSSSIVIMATLIPQFLLPRGYSPIARLSLPLSKPCPRLLPCRYASTSIPEPRTIRLEKPAKFNPPSHGKRLKASLPRHFGPQLTQQQKVEQAKKKYPRMMPPPGTFMFWFLTSRGLHMFISLVRKFFTCYYDLLLFLAGVMLTAIPIRARWSSLLHSPPMRIGNAPLFSAHNFRRLPPSYHIPLRPLAKLTKYGAWMSLAEARRRRQSGGRMWRMCKSGVHIGGRMG